MAGRVLARARSLPWWGSRLRGGMARSLSTPTPSPLDTTASVVEVSATNFEKLVVEASKADPPLGGVVIVDAYADWCGPCKELTPRLEQLVISKGRGSVRLAKLNVDVEQSLSQALNITTLPTLIVVHKGKIVHSVTGALPQPQLEQLFNKALELAGGAAPGERALEEAAAAMSEGRTDDAKRLYAALSQLPEHAADGVAGLALCALKEGDVDTAKTLCEAFDGPLKDSAHKPLPRQVLAQLELRAAGPPDEEGTAAALRAKVEASPRDLDIRLALAQRLVGDGDHAAAIDQCLEIVRQDSAWKDGAGTPLRGRRRGLLPAMLTLPSARSSPVPLQGRSCC